jgi:glycine cleavage system H protein
MNVPEDLLYTNSHEWVRVEDDVAEIGITDFAQEQLSDLTFVELPTVRDILNAGDEVAVVESVKAASDVYSPISGEVIEINDALESKPDVLNSDPYGEGWLFKVRMSNPAELEDLLSPADYHALLPDGD